LYCSSRAWAYAVVTSPTAQQNSPPQATPFRLVKVLPGGFGLDTRLHDRAGLDAELGVALAEAEAPCGATFGLLVPALGITVVPRGETVAV
jgi:hypothetical protein